jgi:hypothetical protein
MRQNLSSGLECRRDEPQFGNIFERHISTLDEPAVAHGLEGFVLSRDQRSGAATLVVELPAASRRRVSLSEASLECFILDGAASVNRQEAPCGSYIFLPQGSGSAEVESKEFAILLVFWNPDMPLFPPPYSEISIKRWWEEPWQETPDGPAHGAFHKSLRTPDMTGGDFEGGPGGFLRMTLLTPGYGDGRQHVHHECWEEVIVLRGDILMAERGRAGFGGYVGNPQEFWHGPFVSHGGALTITHTEAPMGRWEFRNYPRGHELVESYLDTTPWNRLPSHESWTELDDYGDTDDDREYQTWRASGDGEPWSASVGRETASKFRASLRRDERQLPS